MDLLIVLELPGCVPGGGYSFRIQSAEFPVWNSARNCPTGFPPLSNSCADAKLNTSLLCPDFSRPKIVFLPGSFRKRLVTGWFFRFGQIRLRVCLRWARRYDSRPKLLRLHLSAIGVYWAMILIETPIFSREVEALLPDESYGKLQQATQDQLKILGRLVKEWLE